MKHYSKEELDLYRNGKMSVLGKITCAAHLKNCPECTGLLKELEDDDQLLAHLRTSMQIYKNLTEVKPVASSV
jgi:predicted anti-sigma-YlaC factor YlaD